MIVLNIKLRTSPNKHKEVLQTLEELSDYVKRYESCLETYIFEDMESENTIYFTGKWKEGASPEKMNGRFMSVLNGFGSLLEEPIQIKRMIPHEVGQ